MFVRMQKQELNAGGKVKLRCAANAGAHVCLTQIFGEPAVSEKEQLTLHGAFLTSAAAALF